MKYCKWLNLFVVSTLLFVACNDNDTDFGELGIIIETPVISEITSSSVQLQTTFTAASDVIPAKLGFCYSTETGPDIYDATVVAEGNESFSATIGGLSVNMTYYIRAFVNIYNGGTAYSPQVEVLTGEGTLEDQLSQYEAPDYADDYSGISGWEMRSRWNLANVHDPSVMLAEDGYYYMYQTDASYGNAHTAGGHLHGRRSKDLVNWEYLGGTMQTLPGWVLPKLNEIRLEMGLEESTGEGDFGYWAPCVRKVQDGLYRMYYSIVCPGLLNGEGTWSERAFIGMMENSAPSNNDDWVDKGYVVTNASDKGLNFNVNANDWANCYYKWNAIDPSYVITPAGEHWLVYGSWHSGIVAMELNAETGMPKQDLGVPWAEGSVPTEYGQLIYTREANNRWQGSEAPEIIYKDGYYYLFLAYDELSVAYNTRVCRSRDITGPYEGYDGKNITAGGECFPLLTHPYRFNGHSGWVGISHCCVFEDGNGNWFYASQGRLPENTGGNAYSNAIMMGHIRSIRWTDDGWPVVMPERYAGVPQTPISTSELIADWEHIELNYQYQRQQISQNVTLNTDNTVSGAMSGTWSFDETNRILQINSQKLYVAREVDWEASPRRVTLVYAGLSPAGISLWGKKSD